MQFLRFLFASLCLASLWTCRADTVAFLDAGYLKSAAPDRLSVSGYETLMSVMSSYPTPFHVSKAVSEEVDQFAVDNVFQRPIVTWNVLLFGATRGEVFEVEEADPAVKFVEVYGSTAVSAKGAWNKNSDKCGGECLTQSFAEGAKRTGGSYEAGKEGMAGVVKMPACDGEMKLDDPALAFWAMELGAVWNDVLTMSNTERPAQFTSVLTGLYMVRQEHGASSEAFKFAACFTKASLIKVHQTLEDEYNGRVFTAVLMHGSPEAIYEDKLVEKALARHGRSLMSSVKNSDNDPTTTVDEKTKRFSTNAVGYVMFLILLFSSLGGIYVMANMDFTKDTLLYSQAKID